MHLKIITIYAICDDFLRMLNVKEDSQCVMSIAEVMTVGLVAALIYGGNIALSRKMLHDSGYIKNMLSESRLNRRIHKIDLSIWQAIFFALGELFKKDASSHEYLIDSFPVEVCAPVRSYRCRLLSGKQFIGFCKAKKKYYYGFKIHLVTTKSGDPVEFVITPASVADITASKLMVLDLPWGSTLYGDKAYTDYTFEDLLIEYEGIYCVPQRKINAKRQHSGPLSYFQSQARKRIETTISQIVKLFPRAIRAVTSRGFILKMILFMIAFALDVFYTRSSTRLAAKGNLSSFSIR